MIFNNHSNLEGQDAFLGASKYHWINYDETKVNENYSNHDVNSSLLIGHLTDKDTIKVRKK